MAGKLTKDFDVLMETYEDDLNEEMILKGPLRRGPLRRDDTQRTTKKRASYAVALKSWKN